MMCQLEPQLPSQRQFTTACRGKMQKNKIESVHCVGVNFFSISSAVMPESEKRGKVMLTRHVWPRTQYLTRYMHAINYTDLTINWDAVKEPLQATNC